jgi:hypothetical protein
VLEAVEMWGTSPLAMGKMRGHDLAYCLVTFAGVRIWL